jgi:hypothetical protein
LRAAHCMIRKKHLISMRARYLMTCDGASMLTYAGLSVRQILICVCQGHCWCFSWCCRNGIYTGQQGKEHLVLVHGDGQGYRRKSRQLLKAKKCALKTRWTLMNLLLSSWKRNFSMATEACKCLAKHGLDLAYTGL